MLVKQSIRDQNALSGQKSNETKGLLYAADCVSFVPELFLFLRFFGPQDVGIEVSESLQFGNNLPSILTGLLMLAGIISWGVIMLSVIESTASQETWIIPRRKDD